MIFYFQPVHVQLDSGFEKIAEEKFSRLERFFHGEPEVHLIIKKEKFEFILEARIQHRTSKIFMKTKSTSVNAGLDELIDKMKNHLSKIHHKKHDKKNKKFEKSILYKTIISRNEKEEAKNENQ